MGCECLIQKKLSSQNKSSQELQTHELLFIGAAFVFMSISRVGRCSAFPRSTEFWPPFGAIPFQHCADHCEDRHFELERNL
jgi:hypothetical protein